MSGVDLGTRRLLASHNGYEIISAEDCSQIKMAISGGLRGWGSPILQWPVARIPASHNGYEMRSANRLAPLAILVKSADLDSGIL